MLWSAIASAPVNVDGMAVAHAADMVGVSPDSVSSGPGLLPGVGATLVLLAWERDGEVGLGSLLATGGQRAHRWVSGRPGPSLQAARPGPTAPGPDLGRSSRPTFTLLSTVTTA